VNMENLDKITEKLIEWLETTEVLAQEQVPIILQEVLTWHLISTLVSMALILIGITGYFVFLVKAKRPIIEDDATPRGVFALIGGIGSSIGFLALLIDLYIVLQIYFAPRVYLIEYLKGLVN